MRMGNRLRGFLLELAVVAYYLVPSSSGAALVYTLTASVTSSALAFIGVIVAMVAIGVIRGCD